MAENKVEVEEKKPASVIEFDWNGTTYTLEYDRESAQQAESMFDISPSDVFSGKVAIQKGLFAGAFIKHHPKIKASTVEGLWRSMTDKDELYKALVGMYFNTVGSLMEDPEEGKAISWKAR